jgi:hypothetical protein
VRLSISIDPGYLQFTKGGDRRPLAAKALDPAHNPVTDARYVWRSADTSVATVQDGVVTAMKDGITRIWAVSGVDSSFAVAVVQIPRVVTLTLQPALTRFESLGDTTTLALNNPDSLVGPRPMCMADDDKVAVIDTMYQVHSVGNGTTLVRCRAGEAEGSMRVTVQQRIARVGIVTGVTRTLRLERDTIHLGLAKVDKKNTPVDVGTPTWRSLDTGVVSVDPTTGAAVGKVEGTGKVVAVLQGFADTTELEVIPKDPVFVAARPTIRVAQSTGPRGARGVPGGGGARGSPNLGPRPASTLIGVRDILASDSVFQAQTLVVGHGESPLHLSFTVVSADHVLDEGLGREETSGLLFGGELELTPSPTFSIKLTAAISPSPLTDPGGSSYSEMARLGSLDLGVGLFPWLTLKIGGGLRYSEFLGSPVAWLSARTGAEAHFDLGGSARGVIGFTALPLITAPQHPSSGDPSFGFIGMAGVDYHTGRLAVGARYELERYMFPGDVRKEQFGALRLRVGLNLGGQ